MTSLHTFLEKQQFGPQAIDVDLFKKDFVRAMREGLKKDGEPMLMIPAWLTLPEETPVNEPVLVLDIGGSNVRVALVSFDGDYRFQIHQFEQHRMPGIGTTCSKQDFLDQLVTFIAPFWGKSDRIGLCFSYEMSIQPNGDGRIVKFSKEVHIPEMEGELLGEQLKQALKAAGYEAPVEMVMLNDTVACLLGGYAVRQNRQADGAIGLILGTGINTAYVEQTGAIEKLQAPFDADQMIINMESGGYAIQTRAPIDVQLDAESQVPNFHRFEKMISGRYLGDIGTLLLREACDQALFGPSTRQALEKLWEAAPFTTLMLDQFLQQPWGDNVLAVATKSLEDKNVMTGICMAVFDRAAFLTVLELTALLEATNRGIHPSKPVLVCIEGSTYSRSKWIKPLVARYIQELVVEGAGRYVDLMEVENSNLMGAALAAYSIPKKA